MTNKFNSLLKKIPSLLDILIYVRYVMNLYITQYSKGLFEKKKSKNIISNHKRFTQIEHTVEQKRMN